MTLTQKIKWFLYKNIAKNPLCGNCQRTMFKVHENVSSDTVVHVQFKCDKCGQLPIYPLDAKERKLMLLI